MLFLCPPPSPKYVQASCGDHILRKSLILISNSLIQFLFFFSRKPIVILAFVQLLVYAGWWTFSFDWILVKHYFGGLVQKCKNLPKWKIIILMHTMIIFVVFWPPPSPKYVQASYGDHILRKSLILISNLLIRFLFCF